MEDIQLQWSYLIRDTDCIFKGGRLNELIVFGLIDLNDYERYLHIFAQIPLVAVLYRLDRV
jgi:hypothetical protein